MSDFKALAKHSTNYLFATMATKALAFISIPVYTRLLSRICIYNHRTTKTNQKYPSVNL